MFKNGMRPIHPGEILLKDYIQPMGISVRELSRVLHVPYSGLLQMVHGKRELSAELAMCLESYFGSSAQGWLALQTAYDLRMEEMQNVKQIIREIVPFKK